MESQNFVKIKFIYHDEEDGVDKIESMWASLLDKSSYRIENSPFYVLGFAMGDIISVKEIKGELFAGDLMEASGNSTVHLIFFNKEIVQKTRDELKQMGCSSELSNIPSLISVNIPAEVDYYQVIKPYLNKGVELDWWDYQEACLAH